MNSSLYSDAVVLVLVECRSLGFMEGFICFFPIIGNESMFSRSLDALIYRFTIYCGGFWNRIVVGVVDF